MYSLGQRNNVFGGYVKESFKKLQRREGNQVKRSIAKLTLNALYGKTLQKVIFNQTAIVNDIFEFNN